MAHRLSYFTLIFLTGCSNLDIESDSEEQNNFNWKKPEPEGHWKLVSVQEVEDTPFLLHYPNPHTPADELPLPQPPYNGPDLIFEKDTMYVVEYPERLATRLKFSLSSGYLHTHSRGQTSSCPVELTNDTLFIYDPLYEKTYLKKGYVKTSFNDSIVTVLKKYGVNYPELAGTWLLMREANTEEAGDYLLKFPHAIPDSIVISRDELTKAMHNNMVYWMSTDGKKRDYILSYNGNYLFLTPGKWYHGDDARIIFTEK